MIELSILIPAYNAERWLPRCLNSILDQIEDGVEVIIVDDGSKDETLQCARGFTEKYDGIKVFSKKNEGVGAARNFLLDKAEGEFIWFIDSDDYIVEGCLSLILSRLSESIDLLSVAYNDVHLKPFNGSGLEFIKNRLINGYLWSKIIRRQVINDANIRFDSERYSQEDWFFLMRVYPLLNYVRQIPLKVYIYSDDNEQSVMREVGMEHKRKLVADSRETICNFKSLLDGIRKEPYAHDYEQWMNFSAAGYLYSLFPLDYSIVEIRCDLDIFRERGVYPVGKTGIRKFDLFLTVVNHEWLYLMLIRLYRLFK
ncbi:glycosyltransferase family A protein [Prevotella denticola]|jgi:spore coat polysaccharide biosynthesis protein|uniref:glycosyltransferase family 2 protein n=1 Tax=Prevotella denticola TaxID=28129 RepID=UPI001C5F79BD|nr:glycosyltransferase family A protein [Prevotella denticola]MBW4759580.1 glycosyltransferase family 2 protein [Prevotella denticola]